eukprot:6197369-Pleurochrysis_carterae.AAC.2
MNQSSRSDAMELYSGCSRTTRNRATFVETESAQMLVLGKASGFGICAQGRSQNRHSRRGEGMVPDPTPAASLVSHCRWRHFRPVLRLPSARREPSHPIRPGSTSTLPPRLPTPWCLRGQHLACNTGLR